MIFLYRYSEYYNHYYVGANINRFDAEKLRMNLKEFGVNFPPFEIYCGDEIQDNSISDNFIITAYYPKELDKVINLFKNIIEGNVEGFSSEFLEFLVKNLTLIK